MEVARVAASQSHHLGGKPRFLQQREEVVPSDRVKSLGNVQLQEKRRSFTYV